MKSFDLVLLHVVPGESTPSSNDEEELLIPARRTRRNTTNGDIPGLIIPPRRRSARQERPVTPPAPTPTPTMSDEDVPIVDMGGTLLAREELEEGEIQHEYANMLNYRQAAVFARAVHNGDQVRFVISFLASRHRTTLGKTWQDYDIFTTFI